MTASLPTTTPHFATPTRSAARLTGGNHAAAEDIVHDAYLSLMRAAQRSDVTEVTVGWIVTAVRNRFIDGVRHHGDREAPATCNWSPPPTHSGVGESSTGTPSAAALLAALSDRERAAMVFHYVDDLPVADVAALLETSVRATESLLQRAKRKARRAGGGD